MGLITTTGLFSDITDAQYQNDCCAEMSLRSSVAFKLIDKGNTPAAVAYEIPRLNPDYVREEKRAFDIGKACHAMLFGKGAKIKLIDGYNYNTNEPKGGLKKDEKQAIQQAAYDAGEIPLLIPQWKQVQDMVAAAKRQIDALLAAGTIEENPFNPRESEQVLVCRIGGVLCRVMMDGFSLQNDILSEYKTEGISAAKDLWMWRARKLGYIFRLEFYRKCAESLQLAYSPAVNIFVQESFPPYLLAFYRVDDELLALENPRVMEALKIWARCTRTGIWPGYPVEGYDLDLTEKEAMREVKDTPASGHVSSDDIAYNL